MRDLDLMILKGDKQYIYIYIHSHGSHADAETDFLCINRVAVSFVVDVHT